MTRGGGVEQADAIAVNGPEQHDEAGQFEQGLALGGVAGAELQAGGILENDEKGQFAFLDEFFAVGFAEARGDVPVDVAHIVAEGVFDDLIEFHAPAAKGRAILAAEHIGHGVFDAPLQAAEQCQRWGGQGRGGGRWTAGCYHG